MSIIRSLFYNVGRFPFVIGHIFILCPLFVRAKSKRSIGDASVKAIPMCFDVVNCECEFCIVFIGR